MKVYTRIHSLFAFSTLCALVSAEALELVHKPLEERTFGLLGGGGFGGGISGGGSDGGHAGLSLSAGGVFEGALGQLESKFGLGLGLNFGLRAGARCPLTFRCNGSGHDGYEYDINGNGCPSYFPSSWRYFGIEVGWQPPASFQCGASWTVPSQWIGTAHLAPWYNPGAGVALGVSGGLTVPSWWLPSRSWKCAGHGRDGFSFDIHGNLAPVGMKGFMYFGVVLGWLPPLGFECDIHWVIPSGCNIHGAVWWSPPVSWTPPPRLSCPPWWTCKACSDGGITITTTPVISVPCPTATTTSSHKITTTTKPGTTKTTRPATHTSSVKTSTHTSRKPHTTTKKVATTTKKASTTTTKNSVTTTTKKATTTTTQKSASTHTTSVRCTTTPVIIPGGSLSPAPTPTSKPTPPSSGLPPLDGGCNGSGQDGWPIDHHGNTAPSGCSGWHWFGGSVGWQPPKNWVMPHGWVAPKWWLSGSCSFSAGWWAPPTWWSLPSTYISVDFVVPNGWIHGGWTTLPSHSWTCDGSGLDGFEFDFEGKMRPVGFPSGFLYFGIEAGWQPPVGFKLPSSTFVPPSPWLAKAHVCTWWQPNIEWYLRGGCSVPKWWNVHGRLRGEFRYSNAVYRHAGPRRLHH